MRSFVVNSKHNASAEQAVVLKSEVGVVVILDVPKAFACYSNALALYLADNCLNNDFVGGDGWRLKWSPDLVHYVFSPALGAGVIVLLAIQVALDHLFDAGSDLARVKPKNELMGSYLSFSLGSSL